MRVGVLGPVGMWVDGAAVEVGPPRQQAVLAALAVDAGRPVAVDTLVERVWGADAQPAARSGLYSYLTRLRRVVAGAGAADAMRLVSKAGGYVLEMDPDRVDVCRFRRLVRAARAVEDDQRRADLLEEAVGLWRGAALAGLPADWAERTRQLLDREQLDAILLWAQAELRLGRAGLVASTLRKLVDQYPLVEPLAGRLVEALARDGRTAEALECYASTRRRLVERLGIEPGVALRRIHHAVLTGDLQQDAARGGHPRCASCPANLGTGA
jgi:DNA-binding SARP family transcriptional activator